MKSITEPLMESLSRCFSEQYEGINPKKISLALDQYFSKSVKKQKHQLLTIKESASFLKVSTRTIHNLLKNGDLKRVKVGRATRITEESLQAYINR